MKKILRQFRYYGTNNPLNAPSGISKDNLQSGHIFRNSEDLQLATIVAFGIQTVPGVQFYINDSLDTVVIGQSGIYELDLSDGYEVHELRFTSKSLDLINNSPEAYLIIDIIYSAEG